MSNKFNPGLHALLYYLNDEHSNLLNAIEKTKDDDVLNAYYSGRLYTVDIVFDMLFSLTPKENRK